MTYRQKHTHIPAADPTGSATADSVQNAAPRSADTLIFEIAAQQHGVVSRWQLLKAGVSGDAIDRRMKTGRLRAVHRGVYQASPIVAVYSIEMAAILACGGAATISHVTAATQWQLRSTATRRNPPPPPASLARRARRSAARSADHAAPRPAILPAPPTPHPTTRCVEVLMSKKRRRRTGIRVHVTDDIRDDEVTTLDGVPITTPARTLLDIAELPDISSRELEQALAEALARRLTTLDELRSMIARHPRHRGAPRLRRLIEADEPARRTHSEAEEKFLDIVQQAPIPMPQMNVFVAGFQLDCWWPDERLAVEIDGYAYHGSRRSYEGDRRRDAQLAAAGIQVIRITWQQLVDEPLAVMVRLAQALALRRTMRVSPEPN